MAYDSSTLFTHALASDHTPTFPLPLALADPPHPSCLRGCFQRLCMCTKGFDGQSDGEALQQPPATPSGVHRYHPVRQMTPMQDQEVNVV